ncbi:hypothetical protein KC851_03535 [Candidatus Kaiserbacteria bacterium]|nr:hypothetical protein [Candidatus Kaiserbacteria bacterium]
MQGPVVFSPNATSLYSFVELSGYFIMVIYIVYTVILFYHWKNYGTDAKVTTLTLTSYLVVTVPLMIIIFILPLTI